MGAGVRAGLGAGMQASLAFGQGGYGVEGEVTWTWGEGAPWYGRGTASFGSGFIAGASVSLSPIVTANITNLCD